MGMKKGDNCGVAGPIRLVSTSTEFTIFDTLPPELRAALRNSLFKYSATECLEAMEYGVPASALISIIEAKDRELSKIGGV